MECREDLQVNLGLILDKSVLISGVGLPNSKIRVLGCRMGRAGLALVSLTCCSTLTTQWGWAVPTASPGGLGKELFG